MSELNRRQALRLLAALGAGGAAAPVLAACGGGDTRTTSRGPVTIGLVVPQSGVYKSIGDELTNGFQLYLSGSGNTLGGHPVKLVIRDEGETADSGLAAVQQLIKQDNVTALSGIASSATMDAVKDLVEGAQIPLVGSNASPTTLQGVKYIWRTSYVNTEPGQALGRHVADQFRGGAVARIAADYQAGRDEVQGFSDAFGRDFDDEAIYTPFSPSPSTDFGTHLARIRNSGARAVFAFYAGTQATEFVKQYRQFGLTMPLYAPGFLTEGVQLRDEGDNANGIYTSMNYSPDLDNEANRTFASNYQSSYDTVPTTYAMASYDAAFVLDKAIALAGGDPPAPRDVNLAMGRIGSIDSPRGSWQFNQSRTPLQKWYLRQVRRDGEVLANTVLAELTTLG